MKVRFLIQDTIKSLKKAIRSNDLSEVSIILTNIDRSVFTDLSPSDRENLIIDIISLAAPRTQTDQVASEIIRKLTKKTSENEVEMACIAFQLFTINEYSIAQAQHFELQDTNFSIDSASISHEDKAGSRINEAVGKHSSSRSIKKHTIDAESENTNDKEKKHLETALYKEQNDRDNVISIEYFIEQLYSDLDLLPIWLQNTIKNSYTYKAVIESIKFTLEVLIYKQNFSFFSPPEEIYEQTIQEDWEGYTAEAQVELQQKYVDLDLVYSDYQASVQTSILPTSSQEFLGLEFNYNPIQFAF